MSACRSCGAAVRWEVTAGGRRMPLDAEPVPDGNVVVVDGQARVLTSAGAELLTLDTPRFVSHFATCPQSGAWRRP